MEPIAVENKGKTNMTVAGRTILPGETRHIPAHELPPEMVARIKGNGKANEVEGKAPDSDGLDKILESSVKEITAILGDFDEDQLIQLEELELNSPEARKTLISAIHDAQEALAQE